MKIRAINAAYAFVYLLALECVQIRSEIITLKDLCGQWEQDASASNGKSCVPASDSRCGCTDSNCPRLTTILVFNTIDALYSRSFASYQGAACSSNKIQYMVTEKGTFRLNGASDIANWTKIVYNPIEYIVNIGQGQFFPKNRSDVSVCLTFLDYLRDSVNGCPCNRTYNDTMITMDYVISPQVCPAGTCPDKYNWFSNTTLYSNIKRQFNNGTQLILAEREISSDIGFLKSNVEFTQKRGCGVGCKSCSLDSTGDSSNCTACCPDNAIPGIPSTSNGTVPAYCECRSGFKNASNEQNDSFTCVAAISPACRTFPVVLLIVAVLFPLLL